MPSERPLAFQRLSVPNFNRVVSQARNNLVIVVLKAVDALALFTLAVDARNGAAPVAPVTVDFGNVLMDGWAKSSEETVGSRSLWSKIRRKEGKAGLPSLHPRNKYLSQPRRSASPLQIDFFFT